MLSHWIRFPLRAEKKAVTPLPPNIPGVLPVRDTVDLLSIHQGRLNHINELAGLSKEHFQRFYLDAIERFARFVQQLPASEVHHHAGPGGMLSHGLEACILALKIRRSYLLSESGDAEDIAKMQNVWTYAVFSAALCHDLAKVAVDQKITVYNEQHQPFFWNVWENFIDEQDGAKWYTTSFVRHKQYRLHEQATPLLAHRILPPEGVKWIADDAFILGQWLACMAGDRENAAAIGEIVGQADQQSVATSLGADSGQRMPGVKAIPLHEKMLTALRFLLSEGGLPLNRNGAAGWVKGDACWMVSKRTIDAIRDQLTTDGQSGIPTKNGRMFDILQEHSLLMSCGDKAIWKVTINGEDWSNELTVIKIPVSKIWINHSDRPDEFQGTVIVSEKEHVENEAKENTVATEKTKEMIQVDFDNNSDIKTTELLKSSEHQDKATRNKLDISSFLPSPIENDHVLTHDENKTSIDNEDQPAKEEKTVIKENYPPQKLSNKTCNIQFFEWLQDGVLSGKIKTNAAKARVHVVSEGVIVVTPGIFQDFSESTQHQFDWKNTQKMVLKQKLHSRDDKGLNIRKYEVKGQSRMTKINTILFNDPSLIFRDTTPPSQNPHLTQVS